eukprot:gene22593-30860_t
MYNIKCRLFVGNISENYSSADLQELFSKYGEVVEATINVDLKTKRNLSYGFITYAKSESAQLAMIDLDGFEIHGRPLRVGKVINKRDKHEDFRDACGIPSVHVSYISYQIDNLVTVESLQALFSTYGTVLDVSIKRSTIDKTTKFQSGFGFIHYSSQQDGIAAAFQAAKTLYDERIENVNYTCKISHALEKFLTSERFANPPSLMGPPTSTQKGLAVNKPRAEPARRYDINPSAVGGRGVPVPSRDRDRERDRDRDRMGSQGQAAATGHFPVDRSFDAELSPLPSSGAPQLHDTAEASEPSAVARSQSQSVAATAIASFQAAARSCARAPMLSDWDAIPSDSEDTWEQPYQSTSAGNSSPTSGMISSHSCQSRSSYDFDNGGGAAPGFYGESLDSFDSRAAQLRGSRPLARMEDSLSTAGEEWRSCSASFDDVMPLPAPAGRKESSFFPQELSESRLRPAQNALSRSIDSGIGGPFDLPLASLSLDSAAFHSVRHSIPRECGVEGLLAESLLLDEQRPSHHHHHHHNNQSQRPRGERHGLSSDAKALFGPLVDPPRSLCAPNRLSEGYSHWDRRSDDPSQLGRAGDTRTTAHSRFEPQLQSQSPQQRHGYNTSTSTSMGRASSAVDHPLGFGDEADSIGLGRRQPSSMAQQQLAGLSMSSRAAYDAPPHLQEDSARHIQPGQRYHPHPQQQPYSPLQSQGGRAYGALTGAREALSGTPLEVTVRFRTSASMNSPHHLSAGGGDVIDVDPQTAAAMLGLLLQEGKQQIQLLQPPQEEAPHSNFASPSHGGHPYPHRPGHHGATAGIGSSSRPPASREEQPQPQPPSPFSRENLSNSQQHAPQRLPRDIPPQLQNEYAPRKPAEQSTGFTASSLDSGTHHHHQHHHQQQQHLLHHQQYHQQYRYHQQQQQPQPLRYPGSPCDMRTCN